MTMAIDLESLDTFEDDLIAKFKGHPLFAGLARLPEEDFAEVLLQRRFLSLAFTPAYDLVIDLLEDDEALRIARIILREEYPDETGCTKSHREETLDDLMRIGISRERIVNSRPSRATITAITRTFTFIADAGRHEFSDTRLLTILRFWGEVLVSVEYGQLWSRLKDRLMTPTGKNLSTFYYPHFVHDAKGRPLAKPSPLAATHSDRLGARLKALLATDEERRCFRQTEKDIIRLKTRFYDQFAPMLGNVRG